METSTILLVVALLPAVVLCGYVYHKDRAEKEPIGLLALLLGLGAFSAVPVLIVSDPVNAVIDGFFSLLGTDTGESIELPSFLYHVYLLCSNIIGVALLEEGFKWIFMFFPTRKNKNFNYLFDGLIYGVFVSLGFAALENILYTFNNGIEVGLMRAFTAVPGHMFDGVIMGYYYTIWNVHNEASKLETLYANRGIINVKTKITGKTYLVLSIVVPVLAHGIYDYLCSYPSTFSTIIFFVFLAVLYFTQFKRIKSLSAADNSEIRVAASILFKKYPELPVYLEEEKQKAAGEQAEQANTDQEDFTEENIN